MKNKKIAVLVKRNPIRSKTFNFKRRSHDSDQIKKLYLIDLPKRVLYKHFFSSISISYKCCELKWNKMTITIKVRYQIWNTKNLRCRSLRIVYTFRKRNRCCNSLWTFREIRIWSDLSDGSLININRKYGRINTHFT